MFRRLSLKWRKNASVSLIFSLGRQLHLKSKKEREKKKEKASEEKREGERK